MWSRVRTPVGGKGEGGGSQWILTQKNVLAKELYAETYDMSPIKHIKRTKTQQNCWKLDKPFQKQLRRVWAIIFGTNFENPFPKEIWLPWRLAYIWKMKVKLAREILDCWNKNWKKWHILLRCYKAATVFVSGYEVVGITNLNSALKNAKC